MTNQAWDASGGVARGGGPPPPSLGCPIMPRVGWGINPWRGPRASLLALSSSLVTYVG